MRRRIVFPLVVVLSLTCWSRAWGWLSTGHRIVAYVAWYDLTPTAQSRAVEILKQHPRFQQDLLEDVPTGTSDFDAQRYAFASAATWPDMVRSFSNPMHAAFNHPNWHYIDLPFAINGQPVPPKPHPAGSAPTDILEALDKNVADLKDPAVSGANKAVALCWILHLCGDIHQPLHCASLYSPQFPNGDQGGNAIIVLREPPYPDSRANLHFVWDSLPGNYLSRNFEEYIAQGLRNDPEFTRQRLAPQLNVKDFSAWAGESHDLAVQYAYLNGQIKGLDVRAAKDPNAVIPGLPAGYVAQAEQIARRRLILGGYRTADLLNSILDSQ
jgi:hypothetical protein